MTPKPASPLNHKPAKSASDAGKDVQVQAPLRDDSNDIIKIRTFDVLADHAAGFSHTNFTMRQVKMSKNFCEMMEKLKDESGPPTELKIVDIPTCIMTKVQLYCENWLKEKDVVLPGPSTAPDDSEEEEDKDDFSRTCGKEIGEWDKAFLGTDNNIIFHIINAADFLTIEPLLNVSCKSIARQMEGMSRQKMKDVFQLEEPDEEEHKRVNEENKWCRDLL